FFCECCIQQNSRRLKNVGYLHNETLKIDEPKTCFMTQVTGIEVQIYGITFNER
ncbi:MAG: hypothetical protein RLZZ578_1203, partial [Bacteroidota bacterium]